MNLCNAKLQEDSMTVRNLIKQSNVTLSAPLMILLTLWNGTRNWLKILLLMYRFCQHGVQTRL